MTLVRILDEFENSDRDRRLGGLDVASRFVCVSVLPSLNHNENPLVVPSLLGKQRKITKKDKTEKEKEINKKRNKLKKRSLDKNREKNSAVSESLLKT